MSKIERESKIIFVDPNDTLVDAMVIMLLEEGFQPEQILRAQTVEDGNRLIGTHAEKLRLVVVSGFKGRWTTVASTAIETTDASVFLHTFDGKAAAAASSPPFANKVRVFTKNEKTLVMLEQARILALASRPIPSLF
ncbi:hypothetical protein KA012_03885 [Candidatus Woesebacteria bacterium]|nr:hypothetical protein [Candidatus Woesebacteria bacterium]